MIIDVCNQQKLASFSKRLTKYLICWLSLCLSILLCSYLQYIYIEIDTYTMYTYLIYVYIWTYVFLSCATFGPFFIPFLCHFYLINFLLLIFVCHPTGWSVFLAGQWGGTSYFRTKRAAYVAQGKTNCHIGDTTVATDAACGLCKWYKWMKKSQESPIKEI